jgi:LmbE family N-acetylglucosaminyl deacetylase
MSLVQRIYNIISPHLDDAVLSCAHFLAANPGSRITTVFANGPTSVIPLPPWDKAAKYFIEGTNVLGIRRGEDMSAAAFVNASTMHLSYWDRQYRRLEYGYDGLSDTELPVTIADDLLSRSFQAPADAWVIPLGLGHPDHRITADAGFIFAKHYPGRIYLYAELPYAVEDQADMEKRKNLLAEQGFTLVSDSSLEFANDPALKAAAIRCHWSQHQSLRRRAKIAVRAPELIWELVQQ